jgi:hypothetical protein
VLDVLYIAGTILFFALTLLYVRGCEALGNRASTAEERDQ